MSHYDKKVGEEFECELIEVAMQDTNTYRKYRKILLTKYPQKAGMGWPTYLIVDNLGEEFKIIGEIKGGMAKGEFRNKLKEIIG